MGGGESAGRIARAWLGAANRRRLSPLPAPGGGPDVRPDTPPAAGTHPKNHWCTPAGPGRAARIRVRAAARAGWRHAAADDVRRRAPSAVPAHADSHGKGQAAAPGRAAGTGPARPLAAPRDALAGAGAHPPHHLRRHRGRRSHGRFLIFNECRRAHPRRRPAGRAAGRVARGLRPLPARPRHALPVRAAAAGPRRPAARPCATPRSTCATPHRPEGAVITVTATPWRDPPGELLGGVAVFRDITAHRNADDAVRRAIQRGRADGRRDLHHGPQRRGRVRQPRLRAHHRLLEGRDARPDPELLRSGPARPGPLPRAVGDGARRRGLPRHDDQPAQERRDLLRRDDHHADQGPGGGGHALRRGRQGHDRPPPARRSRSSSWRSPAGSSRGSSPPARPSFPGFDLAGAAHPAAAMCGDYFDYVVTEDGRLAIVIGDVSGHGLGPPLVMAATRAYLRAFLRTLPGAGDVLRALNRALIEELEDGRFVTMLLACLDARARSPDLCERRASLRVRPGPRRAGAGRAREQRDPAGRLRRLGRPRRRRPSRSSAATPWS